MAFITISVEERGDAGAAWTRYRANLRMPVGMILRPAKPVHWWTGCDAHETILRLSPGPEADGWHVAILAPSFRVLRGRSRAGLLARSPARASRRGRGMPGARAKARSDQ